MADYLERKYEITPLFAITASVKSVYCLLAWAFTIHTIYSIRKNWKYHSQSKTVTFLTVASMISFACCHPFCISTILNPLSTNPQKQATISIYFAYWFFNIGRIMMYLLFLAILESAFHDTRFAMPKCIKFIYIILSVVIPSITMTLDTIEKFAMNHSDSKLDTAERWLSQSNNVIISTFAACLFLRGLYHIAHETLQNDPNCRHTRTKVSNLMDPFVKYCIITNCLVIYTIIMLIVYYICHFYPGYSSKMSLFNYTDCFVNLSSVYLRFNWASPIYDKLCGLCHNCTKTRVVNIMKKDLVIQQVDLTQYKLLTDQDNINRL